MTNLTFSLAQSGDAAAVAQLRSAAAERLTRDFGQGHWSNTATEQSVLHGYRNAKVLLAHRESHLVATLRLATRKPWAIDQSYFADCLRPLYLSDMAVAPEHQRAGIGRRCLEEARRIAADWPAAAIRLDAYDAPAGAGGFYARCGYREVGRVTYRKTPLIYYEYLVSSTG